MSNERIVFIIKKRPNIILLMVLLIGANIVAWLWAFTAFSNNTSLLALSLIAWCYGLRHAVDADHIAAIDSATRKLMQQKKRALTTGARFSTGHSTIVVLASIGIALTTSVFKQHMAWFQNVGGLIGTTVSAVFLLILATINLVIFCHVWKAFRHLKRTGTYDGTTEEMTVSGPLNWLFRSAFRLVGKDWHMYFVGFCLARVLIPLLKFLCSEFLLQARPVACRCGQFSCSRRCLPAAWR